MIKVAITGVIGSGKSTIAKIFKEMGYNVIDADEISRKLTNKGEKVYHKIIEAFGREILKEDEEINRKTLAEIVFKDKEKRIILESIIHPEVKKISLKKAKELEELGEKIAFFDIPLLFEASMEDMFDYIILAYADEETLFERVEKRDKMCYHEFLERLRNQIPLKEKVKKSHFVIDTRKDIEELKKELKKVLQIL